jgi:1-deoxy-D-xylulose-5-phosphate synthase
MIVAAPRNGNELRDLMKTALEQNGAPFAIRYPKDSCVEFEPEKVAETLEIGKWEIVKAGHDVAVLSVGVMTNNALDAVDILRMQNVEPTIVHARFIKPLDSAMTWMSSPGATRSSLPSKKTASWAVSVNRLGAITWSERFR